MAKLRFEDVGGSTPAEYVNEAKLQAICNEGWRLVQIIGDHDLHIRFGTPVKGIFEWAEETEPVVEEAEKQPVVKTAPDDKRVPTKKQSFADKVRAQMEADAKGEKKE